MDREEFEKLFTRFVQHVQLQKSHDAIVSCGEMVSGLGHRLFKVIDNLYVILDKLQTDIRDLKARQEALEKSAGSPVQSAAKIKWTRPLTQTQKKYVEYMNQNHSLKEIAGLMHTSYENARQISHRIRKKMPRE